MTPVELVLSKLPDAKRNGRGWQARCPAHEDRNPSLRIAEGDDGRALIKCHAGCSTDDILAVLGLRMADLMPDGPGRLHGKAAPGAKSNARTFGTSSEAVAELERRHGKRSETWTYENAEDQPVGVVVRWDRPGGKDIRPVALTDAGWIIGAMLEPRPLYHLAKLAGNGTVHVVEGEKCVHASESVGLLATTSPGGSNAAHKADWTPLAGRDVVILPDNDRAGRQYGQKVAEMLSKLEPPARVKTVELPGLPKGGDIVDYIDSRDSVDSEDIRAGIEKLANQAPEVTASPRDSSGPVLIRLSDVKPERLQWLWPGRIPLGKLTVIAGDPGLGKSLITLDMAARVSSGTPWPDHREAENPAGSVVLLSAEDGLADTIRPRLDAAGADVQRIMAMQAVRHRVGTGEAEERMFCLAGDLPALDRAIDDNPDTRLVVIDPITAYLGRTDSHKNADVRGLLAPLSELAARRSVAVVAVSHLNKNTAGSAMYRTMGSLAFVAAARAVLLVSKDKNDPARRLVLPVKNNLTPDSTGLSYTLEGSPVSDVAVVAWNAEPVHMTADDALAVDDHDRTELEQAAEWLGEALADGPVAQKDLQRMARANAFTWATVRRAKGAIHAKSSREGFGPGAVWSWVLPGHTCSANAIDAQSPEVSTYEGGEHLCD